MLQGDSIKLFTFSSNIPEDFAKVSLNATEMPWTLVVSLAPVNHRSGQCHSVHYLLKRLFLIAVPS